VNTLFYLLVAAFAALCLCGESFLILSPEAAY
jgi:hypothetical protein